jgi:ribosomal subunit interface protein
MSITITRRNTDILEDMHEYAQKKAEKLIETFPRIEYIHVILDLEGYRNISEVVIQGKNHIRIEADDAHEDMRTAIDASVKKASRQMNDLRKKHRDHKNQVRMAEFEKIVVEESD